MSEADDKHDAAADETIAACLDPRAPRSFFLYAGAGSGKTRSLVEAIRGVCREQGRMLTLTGRKIGVITYTNAACDEIRQRLEYDARVEVSTIHSFAWSLIKGHDGDIRQWLAARLLEDIAELEAAQAKGRAGKASIDRARSIESKTRRHAALADIRRFIYSPTGDNRERDALNHAEVIAMTADFLGSKPALQRLLVTRYPILLIDESQDTSRRLMDALLGVETAHRGHFCLGLFGDTMQRIYTDGKSGLADAIPAEWERPRKEMNHRCPARIIQLINDIRKGEDDEQQRGRSDAVSGLVRLFLLPEAIADKSGAERVVAARMRELSGDDRWSGDMPDVKTLALEHLMAARRFGFASFFAPLYSVERMRTSFLDGTGAGIGFFTRDVLPLVKALEAADRFAIAAAVRRTSPLLDRGTLEAAGAEQFTVLAAVKEACDGLLALLSGDNVPSARAVLQYVAATGLFALPEVLQPFSEPDAVPVDGAADDADEEADDEGSELGGWRLALEAPFAEVEKYDRYVRGLSPFDTHQGVKGLEFPRVMVVISDEEARGFSFSYDKLFGMKDKSAADVKNEKEGKETSIDRTRRLFYVTCSRAEESLAIVYYSADPNASRAAALGQGWFAEDEIEILPCQAA